MQLVFYSIYVCVCMYCCSVTSASLALQVSSLLLSRQGNPYMYYSMCVCIYIYICTHTYAYMYVCVYGASLIAQLGKNLPVMQKTCIRFLGQEDALEKEMSTHSSILAWRISGIEEPVGLQSTGSQESDTT